MRPSLCFTLYQMASERLRPLGRCAKVRHDTRPPGQMISVESSLAHGVLYCHRLSPQFRDDSCAGMGAMIACLSELGISRRRSFALRYAYHGSAFEFGFDLHLDLASLGRTS
jgi:hypothetical protein